VLLALSTFRKAVGRYRTFKFFDTILSTGVLRPGQPHRASREESEKKTRY
jgi:hypothetical protein